MQKSGKKVTTSLENYLEAIYFLNGKTSGVRLTDIASLLEISKPSVNRAVNTLKEKGLVSHERYGSLTLTESGLKVAESIAGRHMVLKEFLIDVLGVDGDTAENEACLIEHHLSADTIEKIAGLVKEKNIKEE